MSTDLERAKADFADAAEKLIEAHAEARGAPGPDPDPKPIPDSPDPQPIPAPDPVRFRTFAIMDHRGQPDLGQFGIEPLKIWYEGAFFRERDNRDNDNPVSFQEVDRELVAKAARGSPQLSVPDIERWANKHTWEVPEENVIRYVEVATTYRQNLRTGSQFGFYTIPPARNYFAAFEGQGSLKWEDWLVWNDRMRPIAKMTDMAFPSLYAPSSVFEGESNRLSRWTTFAVANIQEARRIMGPDKPVYPFLWPFYHPSAKTRIEGPFWRRMLEVCREHADGVVIWDDVKSTRQDFEDLGDWWQATLDFLAVDR